MYKNWSEHMSFASDDTIKTYLANWNQYIPEIVEAAVVEMEKRGRPVAPEKIEEMRSHFEARRQRDIDEHHNNTSRAFFGVEITDPTATALESAPVYYSAVAIQVFATILSPFFASFMLASNIEKIEGKKGFWAVILFGVFHAALVYYINLELLEKPIHVVSLTLNLAGAYVLRSFFWEKFIGTNIVYRKRTLVYPIIAAFILVSLVVMIAIFDRQSS